jgi:uncharacterized protein
MAAFIQFPAHDIRLEGLEVDLALPAGWLEKTLGDTEVRPRRLTATGEPSPGRFVGRLSRSGAHDIVVRGRVMAEVELPCVRCLEPARVDVATELSLLLQPLSRPEGRRGQANRAERAAKDEEYEFSAAEAEVDRYDGETVVLDDFVREAILLEVPAFPLCDESCPGLARDLGAIAVERALEPVPDPRLAPLSAFRQKDGPASIEDLVAAAAERAAAMGKKPIIRTNNRPAARPRKNGKG